jgi:hypothetical protein
MMETHDGRLSEPIPTIAGVKQGCIISPILFLMLMDEVMRNVTEGEERNSLGPFSTVRGLRLCR